MIALRAFVRCEWWIYRIQGIHFYSIVSKKNTQDNAQTYLAGWPDCDDVPVRVRGGRWCNGSDDLLTALRLTRRQVTWEFVFWPTGFYHWEQVTGGFYLQADRVLSLGARWQKDFSLGRHGFITTVDWQVTGRFQLFISRVIKSF